MEPKYTKNDIIEMLWGNEEKSLPTWKVISVYFDHCTIQQIKASLEKFFPGMEDMNSWVNSIYYHTKKEQ